MRKKLLTLLLLLPMLIVAQDQLPNTLVVYLSDGAVQEYPLHNSPEISFDGTNMVINNGTATIVITRDNIGSYRFTWRDYASVESVTTDKNITRRGNEVYISNVVKGAPVTLYSIDGILLTQTATDDNGEAYVSLDRLGKGIYLLTVNRFTTKIIKQ